MPIRPAAPSLLALLTAVSCRGPAPIGANVEFSTERGIVRGVSTEDGILALTDVVPPAGELRFRSRAGNGFFDDLAALERRGDALAVLRPRSSRPSQARFAAYPAGLDDRLFLEVLGEDGPELLECRLLFGGARGDLLVPDEEDLAAPAGVADLARRYAGSGVLVWRDETMELVGVLNGVYSEAPAALAFIGLDEMSTLLPAESSYFTRRAQVRRADFEYGTPRDFEGEKAPASDAPSAPIESPGGAR
jgi:hypothetical protein